MRITAFLISSLSIFLNVSIVSAGDNSLPPPDTDEVFVFDHRLGEDEVLLRWEIKDRHHLYKERLKIRLSDGLLDLSKISLPHGLIEKDEILGVTEVYRKQLEVSVPKALILGQGKDDGMVEVTYQGCADQGICYPPTHKKFKINSVSDSGNPSLTVSQNSDQFQSTASGECEATSADGFVELAPQNEQCGIVDKLKKDSLPLICLSFMGMGLLLAFTPCIFPMIPILSGIIVGSRERLSTARAFLLSLSYVVASSLAYTVFGVTAALFGKNLQSSFQNPWVISAFSALFIVLALSMFGVIHLQAPGFIQSKIAKVSNKQKGGSLLGAGVMGALSALIVGPCVAAPLAGALIYIGQTGDAFLGGLALFSLGIGMGIPLIMIGLSAGKLLPRAGVWMDAVKSIFGIGLIAVAIWLLSRILPSSVSLMLWSVLLIITSIYVANVDASQGPHNGFKVFRRGLGIAILIYGVILMVGAAAGGSDPLLPLEVLNTPRQFANKEDAHQSARFKRVSTLVELKKEIEHASSNGRFVMLDFYADWCVSCKEMERYTFGDPEVSENLKGISLLQVDLTSNSDHGNQILREFSLIGPPAVLFFGPDKTEKKGKRLIGFVEPKKFIDHLRGVL